MISIIVAYDQERAIAKDGKIPWQLPEDMAHFKTTTKNSTVVMGRKTWESLPSRFRPLPGRCNIVLSRHGVFSGALATSSLEDAVQIGGPNVFIIGGGQIYREALERGLVDKVIASEVKGVYGGDVFFPELPGWIGKPKKMFEQFTVVEYTRSQG